MSQSVQAKLASVIKRKIIQTEELPKGFIYFSATHIVEGTGDVNIIDARYMQSKQH